MTLLPLCGCHSSLSHLYGFQVGQALLYSKRAGSCLYNICLFRGLVLSNALIKKCITQGSAMDAGLLASHQAEELLALTIHLTVFLFCQGLIDHLQGDRLC